MSRKRKESRRDEAIRLAILAAALEALTAMISLANAIIDAMNQ